METIATNALKTMILQGVFSVPFIPVSRLTLGDLTGECLTAQSKSGARCQQKP